jgi:hypothetical protein
VATAAATSVLKDRPPGGGVARHQVVEARFVDRDITLLEGVYPCLLLVDAGDAGTEFGETGAGNQADVAGADHHNVHLSVHSQ